MRSCSADCTGDGCRAARVASLNDARDEARERGVHFVGGVSLRRGRDRRRVCALAGSDSVGEVRVGRQVAEFRRRRRALAVVQPLRLREATHVHWAHRTRFHIHLYNKKRDTYCFHRNVE